MPRQPKCRERLLLRRLLRRKIEPKSLARALGLRLDELAHWLNEPHVRRLIQGFGRLYDFDAHLNLKPRGLMKLGELAGAEGQANETVRRACADLLKAPTVSAPPPDEAAAGHAEPDADRRREIHEVLSAVGAGHAFAAGGEPNP